MSDITGDLQRRLANLVRRGVIHSVRHDGIPNAGLIWAISSRPGCRCVRVFLAQTGLIRILMPSVMR